MSNTKFEIFRIVTMTLYLGLFIKFPVYAFLGLIIVCFLMMLSVAIVAEFLD